MPKRPPSITWECIPCRETVYSKTPGPCPVCGEALTVRAAGAVPFGVPAWADERAWELEAAREERETK